MLDSREIFDKLHGVNLFLNLKKFIFTQPSHKFLMQIMSGEGLMTDPADTDHPGLHHPTEPEGTPTVFGNSWLVGQVYHGPLCLISCT